MMDEMYLCLFQLLKESLFPEIYKETKLGKNCEWSNVYSEMQKQTIDALPGEWLKKHAVIDLPLYNVWRMQCAVHKGRWAQIMLAQEELIRLLEKNNIACVIIKGSAAGMAYPQPFLRTMGDVDFMVKRRDYDKAAKLLEENGYSLVKEKKNADYHYEYMKGGVLFELHRRLSIISDSDEAMLSLFEQGIDNRESRNIEQFAFPVLPPELNGLVLIFHMNQHLRSGLGLRQIIDWMMYLNENDGIHKLHPYLKKIGMERFANVVTAMCQRYLGLRPFVQEYSDYPCEELMQYILEKGNFGKKSAKEGKISSVFLDMSNPVRIFRRLQTGGLYRWEAAKHYRVLRILAWVYQIGFIIKKLIISKITPKEMVKLRDKGVDQRRLMLKLGLDVERMINSEHN